MLILASIVSAIAGISLETNQSREGPMAELYTIGYEGSDIGRLVETLEALKIEVLADVRELPLSRKKGLSKRSLGERLAQSGIEYIHYRDLGDPKPGRDAAKRGDHTQFARIYLDHLFSEKAQASLSDLLSVAQRRVTCMMCFEKCAIECHRSYIADQAAMRGFIVHNLSAEDPKKYNEHDLKLPRYNPRQSIAAAE